MEETEYCIPTTSKIDDPSKYHIVLMYHEYCIGPFSSEKETLFAIACLYEKDPMWDRDGWCIAHDEKRTNGTEWLRSKYGIRKKGST